MALQVLDCAPMRPWWPRWDLGGVCLAVERDQGLTLVDTGVGLHDHLHPSWVVRLFALDFGLQRDPETTAVRQLARRGIPAGDVEVYLRSQGLAEGGRHPAGPSLAHGGL